MIEFVKIYYFEIAVVIVGLYLFMKVQRAMRKIVGIVFSILAIARLIMYITQMNF